ncbi:MAG: hypothetical protein DMG13_16275 [Acidobacteria bacterium]|nr:MAG: hypothetical protein DMG13_16275 [Acidobacteriota bacterium]
MVIDNQFSGFSAGQTAMIRWMLALILLEIPIVLFCLSGCSTTETQAALADGNCSLPATLVRNASRWNGWGVDAANTRFQDARTAGLTRETVSKLKLKWAFGFAGATEASTQPTVFGGRVFVGIRDGTVYSLDARTGCVYWVYKAAVAVRTPIVIDDSGLIAYFGDMQANMYAVTTNTGELKWKTRVGDHPYASIVGAAKLASNRLIVPVSGGNEEAAAAFLDYVCCKFRGSVVALDAETGQQVWRTYTIADAAKLTGRTAAETEVWGPSGAGVWSSPTLDFERRAIYVSTGVNYSDPPTPTSDAVLALDMDSGRLLWAAQFTSKDRFNFACFAARPLNQDNCPPAPGPNSGIGMSPILRKLAGSRILIVGDKSGVIHALDPDAQGKTVWQTRISRGGVMGGILWGAASDDTGLAYFPISDWDAANPAAGGTVVALRIASGEKLWSTPAPKPTCVGAAGCSAAQAGPATAIPGAVFVGSFDGHLRAYANADGAVIWDFDTLQEFHTVNGINARGGSLNRSGPTVAGGMVYASSGYSQMPAIPGNVLLAFSVDGQ